MAINVALIDKSEITKKMISHCLHYYAVQVHRFENLEDMQSRFHQEQPDIVFIDWDLKKDKTPLASSVKNQASPPLVVLHRGDSAEGLDQMKNRLKKPIDANRLREMVVHLVPKTNQLKIHKFLKYPARQPSFSKDDTDSPISSVPPAIEGAWGGDEMLDLPDQEGVPADLIDPSLKMNPMGGASTSSKSRSPSPVQDTSKGEQVDEGYNLPSLDKTEDYQIEKQSDSPALSAKTKAASPAGQQKTSAPKPPPVNQPPLPSSPKSQETDPPKIFIKEDIDLDEDTANDFAPAALSNKTTINVADTEQNREMILKILNEYKDTLEFEGLMEKSLKNYGTKMVKQIVTQNSKQIIQQAFSGYRETPQFKEDMIGFLKEYLEQHSDVNKQIEKSLTAFIKKQLPILAKAVIEQEVQKLLNEDDT